MVTISVRMSYRDVRNLTEMLRALGYHNLVSMDSFRRANFPLVADLLVWLAKRFDPDSDISTDIETEAERVSLIRNAAQFMALKANVKLNTKKLYQADGYAVKELLKVATLLYDSLRENAPEKETTLDENTVNLRDFDISDKINELKQCRQLATEITTAGATLFDLLGKESEYRSLRHISVGRQYEVSDVETGIKQAIEALQKEIVDTKTLIDNVSVTETSLDAKIERRKVEIDRYEKRLQTLKKVRPAFLEEFTQLEKELEQLFVQYSVRLRCLNYLERLAADAERTHLEKQQMAAAALERVGDTGIISDLGDSGDIEGIENALFEEIQDVQVKPQRPRGRTGARTKSLRAAMTLRKGRLRSSDGSSNEFNSDSDSDDILLGVDGEINSEDDSLAWELSAVDRRPATGRKTSTKVYNSDDEF